MAKFLLQSVAIGKAREIITLSSVLSRAQIMTLQKS